MVEATSPRPSHDPGVFDLEEKMVGEREPQPEHAGFRQQRDETLPCCSRDDKTAATYFLDDNPC